MRAPGSAAVLALALLCLAASFAGCLGSTDGQGTLAMQAETGAPPLNPDTPDGSDPVEILRTKLAEVTHIEVPSIDGHVIPATLYRPEDASADDPVPILIHMHGWAGSRATGETRFSAYHEAGFGVLSWDVRGFGDARSTSQARVPNVVENVADIQSILDHVATLDWVLLDGPTDPRVGLTGLSLGGGHQFLAAQHDGRIDAIAPEWAWHDLSHSIFPQDVMRSVYISFLFAGGAATGNVHPEVRNAYAYFQATNDVPRGQAPGIPDFEALTDAGSPKSYPARVLVPTIIVSGTPDLIFPFDHAIRNYYDVTTTDAPVRLIGTLEAHELPGIQPDLDGHACGDDEDLILNWFQRHLLDLHVSTGHEVCIMLDDDSIVTGDTFPLPGTTDLVLFDGATRTILQGAPNPASSGPAHTVGAPIAIVGIPVLRGSYAVTGPEAITFLSIEVERPDGSVRTVNSQVLPHRVSGSGTFEMNLTAIAAALEPGDTVRLALANHDPQFATNGGRTPGSVEYNDLELVLPALPRDARS